MILRDPLLTWLLYLAGTGQLAVCLLNLGLHRFLRRDFAEARMPLLLREIFRVHQGFISLTLFLFAALTLRFAPELAGADAELARWLCAGIGLFWATRTVVQWTGYSQSHWRGDRLRTGIHWFLTLAYGGCAGVYLIAALQA